MVTRIVSYPPLGQTTVVQEKQVESPVSNKFQELITSKVELILCIELEKAEVKAESLEAVLWHSGVNGQWTELPFKHLTDVADVRIARRLNKRGPKSPTNCYLARHPCGLGPTTHMQLPFLHIVNGGQASPDTLYIALPS